VGSWWSCDEDAGAEPGPSRFVRGGLADGADAAFAAWPSVLLRAEPELASWVAGGLDGVGCALAALGWAAGAELAAVVLAAALVCVFAGVLGVFAGVLGAIDEELLELASGLDLGVPPAGEAG
jgi:hypothetical protein